MKIFKTVYTAQLCTVVSAQLMCVGLQTPWEGLLSEILAFYFLSEAYQVKSCVILTLSQDPVSSDSWRGRGKVILASSDLTSGFPCLNLAPRHFHLLQLSRLAINLKADSTDHSSFLYQ